MDHINGVMTDQTAENMAGKAVVLFPGIGYHCDKPLLYYTGKLAAQAGYEVIRVPYGNFPPKVKGDADKMRSSFEIALEQSFEILKDVRWEQYGQIVFAGKSIGTIVSLAYAAGKGLKVRSLLFTPLAETFSYETAQAYAFHGTADPWAQTPKIRTFCEERGIPLYLAEDANHSLETGDVSRDLSILQEAMEITAGFLK